MKHSKTDFVLTQDVRHYDIKRDKLFTNDYNYSWRNSNLKAQFPNDKWII